MDLLARLSEALDGRYEILREIGRGGMSVVFLARDLRLDREVAIKALRSELTESVGAERFQREIRLVAHFEHIHLLQLHESGTANGVLYYVMPYARDGSLRDLLRQERQLSLDNIVRITSEVADGLEHAHKQGVVHRDIKPENIFFMDGHAVVADFGIAHAYSEAGGETFTEYGIAIGTPAYMSPEQAGGDPNIDRRSDIYSLACVVYEMLSGGPPFEGPTTQAVLAKHMHERVPSLAIVRPGIPGGIEEAVEKALQKVPADRFGSAGEFSAALAAGLTTEAAYARPVHRRYGQLAAATAIALAAVAAAIGIGRLVETEPVLEANRILLFPMHETGFTELPSGLGEIAALRISSALEATEPFKSEWGGSFLPASVERVQAEAADAIARDRGARFRLDGEIVEAGSSASLILRLYDVAGDSLVKQHTATGGLGTDSVLVIALAAASELLPSLVEPGRDVDRSAFRDRDLGAALLWMQGDRQYRSSRFGAALEFYERAVQEDSLLAFAAVKGAQAASWLNEYDKARQLIDAAIVHETALPSKYRHFVHGWQAYLDGNAESAVSSLTSALAVDPEWSEALMALGEVYYHLLPSDTPTGSGAQSAFEAALASDSLFVPALFHLSEIAIRESDIDSAGRMIRRLALAEPDTGWVSHLTAMRDCATADAEDYPWQPVADEDPSGALLAARSLAMRGAHLACARRGFEAVLRSSEATPGNRWGALTGLQSTLLAMGSYAEALALLDSAQSAGSRGVFSLYILDAVAGAPFAEKAHEAEEIARQFTGEYYSNAGLTTRWLLGTWNAQLRRVSTVAGIIRELRQASDEQENQRIARYLEGHLAAARGEIDTALSKLEPLIPSMVPGAATWDIAGALAMERILLADLLLAKRQYDQAERVASAFDHPEPMVFLVFLPRSLMVRLRAALASGRRAQVRQLHDRLVDLGWADSAQAVLNR